MDAPPLVSVVVPTRNRSGAILRCLRGLARQSYPWYEIVVVDDNSVDDTGQVIDQFCAEHPHLVVKRLRNEPQCGANPSRNRGISASSGSYIAFLDDDCIPCPDWIDRLIAAFSSERIAAITGRIDDLPPSNIYELTFKGTHRVHGRSHATRLVAGNMCVRRKHLERFSFDEDRAQVSTDTSVSGRGDEEGLYLLLLAAGYEVRVAADAAVLHEHHYNRGSFFRQAYRGGRSTARLAFKYHLPPRIELVPLLSAWLLLPISLMNYWCGVSAAIFAAFFLAAITYNELVRKRKSLAEWFITLPVLVAYYHCRLFGYLQQWLLLLFRRERISRVRLNQQTTSSSGACRRTNES